MNETKPYVWDASARRQGITIELERTADLRWRAELIDHHANAFAVVAGCHTPLDACRAALAMNYAKGKAAQAETGWSCQLMSTPYQWVTDDDA